MTFLVAAGCVLWWMTSAFAYAGSLLLLWVAADVGLPWGAPAAAVGFAGMAGSAVSLIWASGAVSHVVLV